MTSAQQALLEVPRRTRQVPLWLDRERKTVFPRTGQRLPCARHARETRFAQRFETFFAFRSRTHPQIPYYFSTLPRVDS